MKSPSGQEVRTGRRGQATALRRSRRRTNAQRMSIIYVAPEVAPFSKTGGLADVAGALPKALAQLGHAPAVFSPLYRQARNAGLEIADTARAVRVPIRDRIVTGRIFESRLPGSDVPVFLIGNDAYFDREAVYIDPKTAADYADNCERFVFFSRAVLEAAEALGLVPDIIHCNDWQTGLIPTYIKTLYSQGRAVSRARSIFTVHNLAYQGLFWHWDMPLTGLDWSLFNWRQLEFYGKLNCLKAGLVFADILTTVSRRYAEEIQTPGLGAGLDGVLAERAADLYGIVNGVDYDAWNPETDSLIPATYSRRDMRGKTVCRKHLLASHRLPEREGAPLVGIISRLVAQKGFDLLEIAFDEMMALGLQMVILGTGEPRYHEFFAAAAKRYPEQVAINLTFSLRLSHEIEAGADMFLMPSHYEPCGLNQLYSLKYGTVPVVRATGGLADTVVNATPRTIADGTATGFTFEEYEPGALVRAVRRAVEMFKRPQDWRKLVQNGMAQDWSWIRSAREYVRLYRKALAKGKG